MKGSGQSSIPVERLARLLLQRAREDEFLLRRLAANDDDERLPERPRPSILRVTRHRDPIGSSDAARQMAPRLAALEELISVALLSAQEAADISREAADTSRDTRRQARRGVALALAVGIAGLALAAAGTVVPCLDGAGRRVAAAIEAVPQLDLATAGHRPANPSATARVNDPAGAPGDAAGNV